MSILIYGISKLIIGDGAAKPLLVFIGAVLVIMAILDGKSYANYRAELV